MTYIGRFAPSPTGPLHFGSLVAALGSWLDARAHKGQWLLRIEDLDPPREMAGAPELIIKSLDKHGLYWDGDITYQSQRLANYDNSLQKLNEAGLTYHCYLSRKQLRATGGVNQRDQQKPESGADFAYRLYVDNNPETFDDLFFGPVTTDAMAANADFILKRKDGLHAYMLAVVVDDIAQNISHIVRGADLLPTTCQQIYLFNLLSDRAPQFGHLPLATRANGDKLSKQNHAPAIEDDKALHNIAEALKFLKQPLPDEYQTMTVTQLLERAVDHWQPELFKEQRAHIVRQEYSH